jgi:hypothetical protein
MSNLLTGTLLIVTLATVTPQTLVLRDGSRVRIDGLPSIRDGQVVFRSAGGALYSIALSEVDQEATRDASVPVAVNPPAGEPGRPRMADAALPHLMNDTDRLLRELEANHSGIAQPLEAASPRYGSEVDVTARGDEWSWRQRAREFRENLLRAQEELQLLLNREQALQDRILTLRRLGFRANQFTYDTSELVLVREQMDRARLEVVRARRALDQFLDDARRQDVLPGWLR